MFLCRQAKLLSVYVANVAIQRYMATLKDEQEVMLALADLLIFTYGLDTTVARVKQLLEAGEATPVHLAIAQVFASDAYAKIVDIAWRISPTLAQGDALEALQQNIDKFSHHPSADVIALKREIAAHVVEHPGWNL